MTVCARLSPEALDLIIVYSRAGMSREEIADRVGCTTSTVSKVRRRRGEPMRRSYTLTQEQLDRADEMLDDGASFTEVARTLGTTTSAICKRFPGRGWSHTQSGTFGLELRRTHTPTTRQETEMIVNGIKWTHPPIGDKLTYYGFNPGVMVAHVDGVDLTAWCRQTPAYDTYWTVRLERDGERLCGQVNFAHKEAALVGASELLAVFGGQVAAAS